MTTKTHVSDPEARQVLGAIRETFKAYVDDALDVGPKLMHDFDGREWTIVWEEGPPDWPHLLGGGVDEEMASLAAEFGPLTAQMGLGKVEPTVFPKSVFVEPVNHYSVGIYVA